MKTLSTILILEAIAKGCTRWSEIYRFLLLNGVKIGRPRYNVLLKKLLDYSYIKKKDDNYIIADPVIKYVAENKL